MNIIQAILAALPVAEQVALLFIHSKDATHKYQVVTGTVNEVAPIAAAVAAATASQPAAVAVPMS